MKVCFPLYLVILFASLVACNGQERAKQSPNSSLGFTSTPAKADTSYTTNAPARITRKIRKNKEGGLLMAAFEDVMLYDGKSFAKIPKTDSFKSVDAFDALQDSKGYIWIASTHHGVFRYDGKNFKQLTTDDGLAHNRTMSLYEDKAGNIWIATMGGVSCYNGTSFRNFTTKEGLNHNDVNTIIEDSKGRIWFGTRGTMSIYDPSTSKFDELKNANGQPFTNVWSIVEDKQGNIWIGGKNGLWRYNGSSFKNYSTEFVNHIYQDSKGNIWTTSQRGVLTRYSKNPLFNYTIAPTQVFKGTKMLFGINEDKQGRIWVGTLKGVFSYNGKSINYFRNKK